MSSITSIGRTRAAPPLPPGFKQVVQDLQRRAWELHCLLQCLHMAVACNEHDLVDDKDAAVAGLVRIANALATDLDSEFLAKLAAEAAEEEREDSDGGTA
jgi:hypothetical protein